METTDGFMGFRQMSHFPQVRLAVAKDTALDVPKYHQGETKDGYRTPAAPIVVCADFRTT
eukprot:SAG31_NODE_2920_length_4909_cov_14.892100_7_plen_60_part_00